MPIVSAKSKKLFIPVITVLGMVLILTGLFNLTGMFKNDNTNSDVNPLILWAPEVQAQTGTSYYVSPTGSDSNPGTSESQPWQSLNKVNNKIFQPGDTIKFKAGGVWSGSLKATASGQPDNYIAYTTYGGSYRAKINVDTVGFNVDGYDYIRIENFEMAGGTRGIYFYHNAHHGHVYNCYCHDNSESGIKFGAYQSPPYGDTEGSTVDSSIVENTKWGISVSSDSGQDNLAAGFTVKNCQVSDCTACGMKIMETQADIIGNTVKRCGNQVGYHGIYYGNPSRVSGGSIKYNWLEDNYGAGLKVSGGGTYMENVIVAYNVFYGNGYYGVWNDHGAHDIRYYNNVFYDNGRRGSAFDFAAEYGTQYNLILKNNIFYTGHSNKVYRIRPDSVEGFFSDNNLFYGNSGWDFKGRSYSSFSSWQSGTGFDGSSLNEDPLFLNVGTDFHLTVNSPAIDKGINVGETKDMDGNSVPYGPVPDMGAYEYNSSASIAQPNLTLSKSASPLSATPGQTITYTIHYSNTGTVAADSTVIKDIIPAGVQFVTGSITASHSSAQCGFSNNTLTCNYPTIPAGAEGEIRFEARVE